MPYLRKTRALPSIRRAGLLFATVWLATVPARGADVVDAEILAMEVSNELFPPEDLVNEIAVDLEAARELVPELAEIHVFPDWVPGAVYVLLTSDAREAFLAGTHEELNALNERFGIDEVRKYEYNDVLGFISRNAFHAPLVSAQYRDAEGVIDAYADGYVGDGDDITVIGDGRYLFDHGWGDCPAGCIHEHFWEILVEDGRAVLVAEYGDPLATPVDVGSWSEIKGHYSRSR